MRPTPAPTQDGHTTRKLELLERFGSQMRATARRYSASVHDAEDAYQRASEILLTHDPAGTSDDLCRWLRTTVKHEAIAIRRHYERCVPSGPADRLPVHASNPADTEMLAEHRERLRHRALALASLKPPERLCVVLRAEGFSYEEICARTSFSYTKVNRCLTEGRRSLGAQLTSSG